ncbi:hypothetical protein KUTeg_018666 [Tegillarca granosa]|uniref:Uncharacterized protein n=1 Tax=Tegillarca granosa TaxID=220873 RepID=A0ABQ9EEL1_TEGGR|nr:hypothetical protein KUTeg_018666 [Tegillarca granosa]
MTRVKLLMIDRPDIKHYFDVWHMDKGTNYSYIFLFYSKAYIELKNVVKGSMLLKDIHKLSPTEQTSSLESFHKVVCFFAPKAVHFFYPQMRAR